MSAVLKALDEIFRAENNVHPVSRFVRDGQRVWKLALDCNHIFIVPWTPSVLAPETVECRSCVPNHQTPSLANRDSRQAQVSDWCANTFGVAHASSVEQRALRFLEEAIETYQAAGGKPWTAHKLVTFVFRRPIGRLGQELGGVGVTLLALAEAAGLSAESEELREIKRVLALDVEVMRERNAAKDAAGFVVTENE